MKIKTLSEIQEIVNSQTIKFGLVGGYYDLLHSSHAEFLEKCRSYCDSLIVYIHNDETARNVKGPSRPIVSSYERATLLSKLESVAYVLIVEAAFDLDSMDGFDRYILESIRPAYYFCVKETEKSILRINNLSANFPGINIIGINRQSEVISTTSLEKKIMEGYVATSSSDHLLRIERTLEYKNWVDKLQTYSSKSNCGLAHVGAIIICDDLELSHGVNISVSECWCHLGDIVINKYNHPKCLALHAEQDAILSAIMSHKYELLRKSTIIVEKSPCFDCAKLVLHVGIKNLVYVKEYTESRGRDLLISKGVAVKRYIG